MKIEELPIRAATAPLVLLAAAGWAAGILVVKAADIAGAPFRVVARALRATGAREV